MITKIDIENFGLFSDYKWNNQIKGGNPFKKLNIIYGRNYSGKTTLSNIFKCFESKSIDENYKNSDFLITLDDNQELSHLDLDKLEAINKVRVYNSDFVKENLSWLHNDDGTIKPFTVLGAANIEIEKEIENIEQQLEGTNGLESKAQSTNKNYEKTSGTLTQKRKTLDKKLSDKAREIKNNASIYEFPTYQITRIRQDINSLNNQQSLSGDEITSKQQLLKADSLDDVRPLGERKPEFSTYLSKTKQLLKRIVKPSNPIEKLTNNQNLENWVLRGIELHKNKENKCGFCDNPLTSELWEELDQHFNEESKEFREDLNDQIKILETAKQNIKNSLGITKELFYESLHDQYDSSMTKWNTYSEAHISNIDTLIKKLHERKSDIFNEIILEDIEDNSDSLLDALKGFNRLIHEHNEKTGHLKTDQDNAREALRLSDISKFKDTIDYDSKYSEIERLKKEKENQKKSKDEIENEIAELKKEKRKLSAEAKDESRGAELVNNYLTKFFGHDQLRLEAEGKSPNIKFKVKRDQSEAHKLSEGECSLISFCYFIAKMSDEMDENTIIYIDDPISSLDSNHIFFLFSLIDEVIAKNEKYNQLFISTHNLDFLKYLKRLKRPNGNNMVGHFITERRAKQNSKKCFLATMPSHLKNYVTEFNYLFSEIYSVCKTDNDDGKNQQIANTYNQFYNFPNNLRKFLECYLFYRFPNNETPLTNLSKLFDDNLPSLINRVINEYSHLTFVERGWKPIDVPEAEQCAKIVLKKIKEKDPEQFDALLESIDER